MLVVVAQEQPVNDEEVAEQGQKTGIESNEQHLQQQRQAAYLEYEAEMRRGSSRRNAFGHFGQPRLYNVLRLVELARLIFHLQAIVHLLQVPLKLLFVLVQLADLGLYCYYILPHYVYLVVVLQQALLVLRLEVSQFGLFGGQLRCLLGQSTWAVDQANPIFQDLHGLRVDLSEGEDRGLSATRGLSLPPNFLQDVRVEATTKVVAGLFVEYLGQFLPGDECFFAAVVGSEHFGDAQEAVFGAIHR